MKIQSILFYKRYVIFVVSIALLLSFTGSAQAQEFEADIQGMTISSMKAQMLFLSSDELQGRFAGSEYHKIAGRYIESELLRSGFESVEREYFTNEKDITVKFMGGKEIAAGELNMMNIYAEIKGEDTTKSVVIGAHCDHLGDGDGEIYNGADDNASGVIAVLQIAAAFKRSGVKPACNVVFAFWDGEEIGLFGSNYYCEQLKDKPFEVLYYMNFDMIGRNSDESNPTTVSYIYTTAAKECRDWLEAAVQEYQLEIEPNYHASDDPVGGSDNTGFARLKIPIAWYHTGGHPDYHKVTDSYEKINYNKMVEIIRSAYIVAQRMVASAR